jgi:dethiobiotin synthase
VTTDFFVTGTDTGVGKTLLSALLVAALDRKYWKPIQTGTSEGNDRASVVKWAGVGAERALPETFVFDAPVSPHLAAEWAGTEIDLEDVRRPAEPNPLVIEGAGGVLVPINKNAFMLDLIRQLEAPVIVAARTALGTINHTLLTISKLRGAAIPLLGVVMIGKENVDNRRAVEHYGNIAVIGSIPWLDVIDRGVLIGTFEQRFDRSALL